MVHRRFLINCTTRVILLAGTVCLIFYLFFETQFRAAGILVALTAVLQVAALGRYVTRTNRELSQLLTSIRYSDVSSSFAEDLKGCGFEELTAALNEVMAEFRRAKLEKEEHSRFLQTIIDHVGVGLLAFQADGNVELINNAARRMLKIAHLRRIEDLAPISPRLAEVLAALAPGKHRLVKFTRDDALLQLSIDATGFVLHNRPLLLVAMQDIQNELEEKEMASWQNLIRVLTHEIMNSIAPIASLAATANGLLAGECDMEPADARGEKIRDVCDAVETIEKRSKGLIGFIEKYRELTRIPQPQFQIVRVSELMARVESLMRDQLARKAVEFQARVDPRSLEITADPVLIEQVLINLCKNALEAVNARANACIQLAAETDGQGNPVIKVIDNGRGIPEDVAERIFIPFFTTKPGGSGIGLSLSRQIMRQHKGTLSLGGGPSGETVFTLRF
jgi:nitrogen fixation/metabolism regulation signal transduction histidine kinase